MTHQCSHERAPASAHASAHASVHKSVHEVVWSYVTWSVFTCSVPYPFGDFLGIAFLSLDFVVLCPWWRIQHSLSNVTSIVSYMRLLSVSGFRKWIFGILIFVALHVPSPKPMPALSREQVGSREQRFLLAEVTLPISWPVAVFIRAISLYFRYHCGYCRIFWTNQGNGGLSWRHETRKG